MAIGIRVPPGQVSRPHFILRVVKTTFDRRIMAFKASILRAVSAAQVLWTRLADSAERLFHQRERARQRQHARLSVFEEQYESLVDILCAAAHEGVQPEREREYLRVRAWMLAHYSGIAQHVKVHLPADVHAGMDSFEMLFHHASLQDAVNIETGIDDIMSSRAALEAYRIEFDRLTV